MAQKELVLSQQGFEKLEQELSHLKAVRRKEVAERIRTARMFGDISENSEYESAKNEQAFIEGRILTVERMLRNARLVSPDELDPDVVGVGATVEVRNLASGTTFSYTIVGSPEAEPSKLRISDESPIGSGLMGKRVGDTISVKVPAGVLELEVTNITITG